MVIHTKEKAKIHAHEAKKRIKKVETGKKLAKMTAKKAAKDTAKTVAKETAKETAKTTATKGICSEKYRSSASLYERKRILCCVSGKIRKVIIHKIKKMQRCILSTIIHFCIFLF